MSTTVTKAGTDSSGEHPRFAVFHKGRLIGHLEGHNPTFERSSRGRSYVNARWTSGTRYWKISRPDGTTLRRAIKTRKDAVRQLIDYSTP